MSDYILPLDPSKRSTDTIDFQAALRGKIVGQEEGVQALVDLYQVFRAGLNSPGRPVGNLLFLGPTSSGKTRTVEAAAGILFGDSRSIIKIDCAKFQHSHEIAKLIGSPPGYLGHRETHPLLSQEVLNQYHTDKMKLSFVLFDEIEKASDSLWNLLLGVLDKATLTLGDNRRVDFSRAMIFMTSNLGANEMGSLLRPNMGFAASETQRMRDAGEVDADLQEKIGKVGVEAARRKFTPEFMNRIDKTVVFHPLGQEELRKILDLELNILQQRVFNSPNAAPFGFALSDTAKEYVLREGTDVKYGARHLKRAIERSVAHPLSNLIATAQVRTGDFIKVDFDSHLNRMIFLKEAEDVPAYTLAQLVGATVPAVGRVAAGAEIETPRVVNAKTSRVR